MSAEPIYYDQYDYAIDDNPYPMLKRMRDEAPVWYNEKYNYYALSRYDDVLKASLDTETFSSAHGTVLESMTDEPDESTWILNNDPPYHTAMRSVVSAFFMPARIARLEEEIRDIVVRYLEPLQGRDSFDFVDDFGRWIPMEVVSGILGIPEQERHNVNHWADDMLHRDDGQVELGPVQLAAIENLTRVFTELMEDRRRNPGDDLSSAIANGKMTIDGVERPLTDREAAEFMMLIGAAGNETVARLLGSAAWLLADHPDQRQKLRDNPSLIPRAVEEMLRFEAPTPVQFRRVHKDIELHGVRIPAGANVCLLTHSADRDERQFDNADVFDIERKPRRHVAFGYGVHSCLGSSVARLEIKVALEEVLKRIPDWTVDRANMKRVRTSTVRGYSHVPVHIAQSKAAGF